MIPVVPPVVPGGGRTWTVRRAWPSLSRPGEVDVEVSAPGVPGVRAGYWSPAAGARISAEPGDDRLAPLADLARRGEVVSWRPGMRAVVREHAGAYAKVVRPHAAARVRAGHAAASARFSAFAVAADLTTAADEESGVVRSTALPGRSLHDLGADRALDDAEVARAWAGWRDAWVEVLRRPVADATPHGPRREAGVLTTWVEHADRLGAVDAGVRRRRDALDEALGDDPCLDAPVHRDLHDKQVLWDGARPALLDLDTAAVGEAALDLGNLRAHIAWRHAQSALTAERARAARAEVDAAVRRSQVDPGRVAIYEAATRLRLGCLYLYRPRWRALARRWLAAECAP